MMKLKNMLCLILIIWATPCAASTLEHDLAAFNLITDFNLLFLGSIFVILMQAGFAVAEGGYQNNIKSIHGLVVNYLSAVLGTVFFGFICVELVSITGIVSVRNMSHMLNGWHWNLLFFYTLMATTITTVVGRVIPSSSPIWVNWMTGLLIAGAIFPIFSSWAWGNIIWGDGWLKNIGFIDFAGSTVVHSTAAWIVFAGYLTLKSHDKEELFTKDLIFDDYKVLSFALAAFVLWLAWSGLNIVYITAIPVDITTIIINAFFALVGAMAAPLIVSFAFKHKIISWVELIKSALGGLVAITASCGFIDLLYAFVIGVIAGLLTVYIPKLLIPWIASKHIREVLVVHGFCGVWGTLAISFAEITELSLVGKASFIDQIIGIGVNFIWSFGIALIAFKIICKLSQKLTLEI